MGKIILHSQDEKNFFDYGETSFMVKYLNNNGYENVTMVENNTEWFGVMRSAVTELSAIMTLY